MASSSMAQNLEKAPADLIPVKPAERQPAKTDVVLRAAPSRDTFPNVLVASSAIAFGLTPQRPAASSIVT